MRKGEITITDKKVLKLATDGFFHELTPEMTNKYEMVCYKQFFYLNDTLYTNVTARMKQDTSKKIELLVGFIYDFGPYYEQGKK